MTAKLHFRNAGVLRTLRKLFFRDPAGGGTLRPLRKAFYRDNGVLRQVFSSVAAGVVSFTDAAVSQVGALGAVQTAGYRINASGIVQRLNRTTYNTIETWLVSGAAADFEVVCSASGDIPDGFIGTAVNLSTSPEWTLSAYSGDVLAATLSFIVRPAGGGATLDAWTVTLYAERF